MPEETDPFLLQHQIIGTLSSHDANWAKRFSSLKAAQAAAAELWAGTDPETVRQEITTCLRARGGFVGLPTKAGCT